MGMYVASFLRSVALSGQKFFLWMKLGFVYMLFIYLSDEIVRLEYLNFVGIRRTSCLCSIVAKNPFECCWRSSSFFMWPTFFLIWNAAAERSLLQMFQPRNQQLRLSLYWESPWISWLVCNLCWRRPWPMMGLQGAFTRLQRLLRSMLLNCVSWLRIATSRIILSWSKHSAQSTMSTSSLCPVLRS